MFDSELAAIIAFTLASSENPQPFYWEINEGFTTPSVYFPPPEIDSSGDTFSTYRLDYVWNLKFFADNTPEAMRMGKDTLIAIRAKRNKIPLIDESGEPTGRTIRINDPEVNKIGEGTVELTLDWIERKPYDAEKAEKIAKYYLTMRLKGGN